MSMPTHQGWVVNLLIFLLVLRLASATKYFKIHRYRPMRPGTQKDSFQTPESLCGTASNYSCHDYAAQQSTCTTCTCPSANDTFWYTHAQQWKCVGKSELRQETGCLVKVKGELQSQPLLVVQTGSRYYMDLPIHQSCSYGYPRDTFYRTCNGSWSAASGIGLGTRYTLDVIKRQNRYRYWLTVKTDSRAVNFLQGRIIKLNITCRGSATPVPWSTCFLFKEPYYDTAISCPTYQTLMQTTTAIPTPPLIPTSSQERTPKATLSPTSSFVVTSPVPNATSYPADKEAQSGDDKTTVTSVSATVGALLAVTVTIIGIVICCKRRKRKTAAMYNAALYNVSQDQCSAGIYDETNIDLPSALKSASLMSHSNPAYGRGQDLSISVKSSRHASSPSRLEPDKPELADSSKIIENGSMHADGTAAQPTNGRRNMIVAYENVIVLRHETLRESIPDAEAFYENPGTYSPHYHVLENLRDISSDASCHAGSYMDEDTQEHFDGDSLQEEEAQNSYVDTYTNDDESIYVNSPASTAGSMRDGNFSFARPNTDYLPDEEYHASSFDGSKDHDQDWEMYGNAEAVRSSYMEDGAVNNPGYLPDDEEGSPKTFSDEPIYDNQIEIGHERKTSGAPTYALLKDQPNDGVYEDLRGDKARVSSSDYQSLSPHTARKHNKAKPKIKPKPAGRQ